MSNQPATPLGTVTAPVSSNPTQTSLLRLERTTNTANIYSYSVDQQGVDPNINSGGTWNPDQSAITLQRVIQTAEKRQSGVEIMFLPKVDSKEVQGMKNGISSAFEVPEFFWSRAGFKSNGFFSHNQSPLSKFNGASYGSMSRFLIKEIVYDSATREYGYTWQYISFVTLWYSATNSKADATHILLCFDLSNELKKSIQEAFVASDPSSWRSCPLGLFSVLLPVIAFRYDDALWGFKDPVRDIENSRIQHQTNPGSTSMQSRYMQMHELSRHVIHEVETLEISARTVASIVERHRQYEHDECCEGGSSPDFDFYQKFLANLRCRAEAFEKRLQNEITLAFNLAAAEDNAVANQTQKDGRELTQLVSTATLLFLPGSFVSSFFGMNFFDFGEKKIATSDQIYIFVVVTVIVTIVGFGVWKHFGRHEPEVKSASPPMMTGVRRFTTGFV